MDDIAHSTGMSKRTIYEHFKDKAELLEACLHFFFDHHELDIDKILNSADNIIVAYFKMLESTSKLFFQLKFNFLNEVQKYYPDTFNNTVKVYRQQYLENTDKMLQKGKKDGIVRDDVDPAIMAVLINEVSVLTLHRDVFAHHGFDKKTAMHACMSCITRGMFTEKGMRILDKHITEYKKMKDDNTN
jgi:AcrR family transcriptional regulator